MSKKLALLVGLAALATLVRLLRRRGLEPKGRRPSDPRAGALRDRLAESRRAARLGQADVARPAGGPAAGLDPSAEAASAPASEPAEPVREPELEVEAARQQVYEEGRAALEDMRRSGDL